MEVGRVLFRSSGDARGNQSRPAVVQAPASSPAPVKGPKPAKVNPHKLERAEARVAELETALAEVETRLADPAVYADGGADAAELGTRQAALRAQMGEAEAELLALYDARSEEHTSELQSLMRSSYAVFFLNK